jgi:hypothetical protein
MRKPSNAHNASVSPDAFAAAWTLQKFFDFTTDACKRRRENPSVK